MSLLENAPRGLGSLSETHFTNRNINVDFYTHIGIIIVFRLVNYK